MSEAVSNTASQKAMHMIVLIINKGLTNRTDILSSTGKTIMKQSNATGAVITGDPYCISQYPLQP